MNGRTESHDVFVSYAQPDRDVADRICAAIEKRGVRCWIAHRDIRPGRSFPGEIIQAISSSRLFVLVYSARTESSPHVRREVERAVDRNIRILSFKITDTPPSEEMNYFLAISQWLDASAPPLDKHIKRLADEVEGLLRETLPTAEATPPIGANPVTRPTGRLSRRRVLWGLGGVVLVGAVALSVWGLNSRHSGGSVPPAGDRADTSTIAYQEPLSDSTAVPVDRTPPQTESVRESPTAQPLVAFGSASITSYPASATALLDGARVGLTPLRVNRVEEGRHSVEIVHEGYERFATTIEVRANNAAAVDARLIPLKSSLRVTSHPDSAVVILNGERRGVTPLTLYDIPVGSYALVLERSGCRSYSGTATVAARTMSTAHGELTPITSILRVRVVPSGFIYVNKERRTEDTNATYSTELLPGRYEITAVSLTWGRWIKSVAIANDAEQEITFDFTKEYRVTVTSDPAYAKIYVNDAFTGKYTPSLLTLRPGQRKIEVRLDGYELRDKPVAMTLESDQTEPIHFTLSKKTGL